MNKAITDGIQLMPPPFSAGLAAWSRGDGTPGSATYHNLATAAFVPADQDFGGCLEIQKTDATQRVRAMVQTPIEPGCYLRVTARIKAISGALPTVRIAGYAARSNNTPVTGIPLTGPAQTLTSYGAVVEVSAIIGTGARGGVSMPWGTSPAYGHLGLDLTGPNGGVVRIDDIVIEDITGAFHRELMDWVDVRDYGAVGNGTTDDSAAFTAAAAAADGRTVLVSDGVFRLNSSVTFNTPVRFEGRVTMPDSAILILARNFDLPSYVEAFEDEEIAFKKAFQALLNNADHESLDLGGRRVSITAPIDLQAAVGNRTDSLQRRVIRNGQLRAETGPAWTPSTTTSIATYSTSQPWRLTNVSNVANIQVGSLITGNGVGREVYVRAKNVGAGSVDLSQPLSDAVGTQSYTFTRYKFLLDFSGFSKVQDFEMTDVELQCQEAASGVLLAPSGNIMHFRDCVINRPGHRGIASHGDGCQGMLVDRCKFISWESDLLVQQRQSIAISTNANDIKLRDNRATRFRHFCVMSGAHLMITGNHFFQGDAASNGVRTAGILLTLRACNTTISGNYVDNCHIEWTNEREPDPDFSGGFGFAGLSISNNVFLCSNTAAWFAFIAVKPYGTGHFVNGLSVKGNTFRASSGRINRVERVDTSFADLDLGRMAQVEFSGNTFHNVDRGASNPLIVSHSQNSATDVWTVDTDEKLPFRGRARSVDAVIPRGRIRDSGNVARYELPHTQNQIGSRSDQVQLIWPAARKGTMALTVRGDG